MRICDDLRQAVLQAAIQGKLTKQLPEDGNAKDLLKQIAAEKAELIQKKNFKKDKPLSSILENDIPFEIPENWEWVKLGNVGLYKKGPFGSSLTKSMFVPKSKSTVKVYEQKNAIQKDYTLGDYYISQDYYLSKMKGFTVGPGQIIVSCAGTIGETYIIPPEAPVGIINQALMMIDLVKSINWDFYLIFFDHVLKENARTISKGSAIKNIPPFEIFKNMLMPLPPLAEQQRIVARVEELMARIDDLEKTETELEKLKAAFPGDMKAALLQAAMQGKLTEQLPEDGDAADLLEQIVKEKSQLIKEGKIKKEKPLPKITPDEVPFDIPENWKWERLGNLCSILGGGTPDKNNINYWNGTIPWATVSDMNNAHIIKTILNISQEGLENSSTNIIKKGSIIVATRVGLGKVCYADIDVAINQDLKGLDFFNICDNDFIFYYFKSMASYIVSKGTGTTVKGIKLDFLTSLLIPLVEQKRIVEKLDKLLPLCDGLIEE